MASNLRELVERARECQFSDLDSLELMFEHIASVHQYIFYASDKERETAEYKEQCAYYFVLMMQYLAEADAFSANMFEGLDHIDEAIAHAKSVSGIDFKDVNRKVCTYEMIGELANVTWHHMNGMADLADEYKLRIAMLSLVCTLNYEVRTTTDANLADLVEDFLTKRGK